MNEIRSFSPTPDAPHNVEAEQQLIGAILTNNGVYNAVAHIVSTDHFHDPVHRRIFAKVSSLIEQGSLASPVTLRTIFAQDAGLAELGGPAYLVRMAGAAISSYAAPEYAMMILDLANRRALLGSMAEAQAIITKGGALDAAQSVIETALNLVATQSVRKPSMSFLAAMTQSIDATNRAYQGEASGLKMGLKEFDDLTGGLFAGDMMVIAGATSMGKTSTAMALVDGVAKQGIAVAVASLEMSEASLVARILSAHASVPYFRLRNGDISEAEFRRVIETAQGLEAFPVEIIAPHIREIAVIHGAARRVQAKFAAMEKPLGLIVVDYLQLVASRGQNTLERVSEAARGVKHMAMQLGVPVVVLSQLGRDVEKRDDHRPRLSDLADSSEIEKASDVVMFCHRESYYLEREGPPKGKDGKVSTEALVDHEAAVRATKAQMDLIVGKHRSGAIGDAKIGCDITLNQLWSLGDTTKAMEF